ncbi:hypothetical protein BDY21DRAFT_368846 [Lineolata rhizophorae]|uniref:Uncharacterized protein n=1 Tax=Lineolata rhizophorae TaxID=578093 RepID=A0A6A6PE59_9PEZI|nr:hypothetical protein BDY21DRAFT_368846 [Lineolata rhizophorae]
MASVPPPPPPALRRSKHSGSNDPYKGRRARRTGSATLPALAPPPPSPPQLPAPAPRKRRGRAASSTAAVAPTRPRSTRAAAAAANAKGFADSDPAAPTEDASSSRVGWKGGRKLFPGEYESHQLLPSARELYGGEEKGKGGKGGKRKRGEDEEEESGDNDEVGSVISLSGPLLTRPVAPPRKKPRRSRTSRDERRAGLVPCLDEWRPDSSDTESAGSAHDSDNSIVAAAESPGFSAGPASLPISQGEVAERSPEPTHPLAHDAVPGTHAEQAVVVAAPRGSPSPGQPEDMPSSTSPPPAGSPQPDLTASPSSSSSTLGGGLSRDGDREPSPAGEETRFVPTVQDQQRPSPAPQPPAAPRSGGSAVAERLRADIARWSRAVAGEVGTARALTAEARRALREVQEAWEREREEDEKEGWWRGLPQLALPQKSAQAETDPKL